FLVLLSPCQPQFGKIFVPNLTVPQDLLRHSKWGAEIQIFGRIICLSFASASTNASQSSRLKIRLWPAVKSRKRINANEQIQKT
ncbi:MAG: hypothetical protein ACREEM_51540, partial [Blastocatellia bacterium]